MRTVQPTRLAALAALLGLAAAAQAQDGPRFYVGVTAGVAAVIAKDYDTDRHETGSGRPSAGIYAGLRLFDVPAGKGLPVSLEVGYQDISSHTIPYRVNGSTTDLTARGHSTYAALRLAVPLTERTSLYGRLGAARNVVDGNTPAGQTPIDVDGRRTGVLAGFGAEFVLVPNVLLRAEVTSFGQASPGARAGGVSAGIAVGF
jgi:opacity protein-like surface antigen